MSEAQLVRPDLGYVKEIMGAGGESLKKCYQCATCSVVCELAPDGKPFPRKEMVWAQWGQREQLVSNPDVWLCHQCSDCTASCPRDARPGEVLAAVRRTGYRHFAFPGFMGKLFSDVRYLPVLFAVPVIIILAMIGLTGDFSPEGEIVFSKFLPILTGVDAIFVPFFFFALFSLGVSLKTFWKGMEAQVDPSAERKGFGSAMKEFAGEMISHSTFRKCISSAGRSTAHQLVFFGFVGLFITTSIVLVYEWVLHIETPLKIFSLAGFPPKLIGNVSAVALLAGSVMMVNNRLANRENNPAGAYDWVFLAVIFLVGLTGFLTEITRLADMAALAYPIYFLHLVFVFYIIAYLPFSKLAHLFYRSLAIIHAKSTNREFLPAARPPEAEQEPSEPEAAA